MSDDKTTPNGEAPPEDAAPSAPVKPTPEDDAKATARDVTRAEAAGKAKAKAKKDEGPKQPWEEKPTPPVSSDASEDPDAQALAEALEGSVLSATRFAGDVTLTVPSARVVDICRFLKERGYAFLVDLTAVDWPEREGGRFDIVYWLHRFDDSKRLRLVAVLSDGDPIDSVTGVWKTANWLEREVYDMFGVVFDGHPNLERILMWEGFNGHPLRKDFPVEGIDTGAAIYPDVFPPGHGPVTAEEG